MKRMRLTALGIGACLAVAMAVPTPATAAAAPAAATPPPPAATIPADIDVVAEYPIAVTGDAPNPAAAAAFVQFVFGEPAQQTLAGFGFSSP